MNTPSDQPAPQPTKLTDGEYHSLLSLIDYDAKLAEMTPRELVFEVLGSRAADYRCVVALMDRVLPGWKFTDEETENSPPSVERFAPLTAGDHIKPSPAPDSEDREMDQRDKAVADNARLQQALTDSRSLQDFSNKENQKMVDELNRLQSLADGLAGEIETDAEEFLRLVSEDVKNLGGPHASLRILKMSKAVGAFLAAYTAAQAGGKVAANLPAHLREDAPPTFVCSDCGRKSWASHGGSCSMPQPGGRICNGVFVPQAAPGSTSEGK